MYRKCCVVGCDSRREDINFYGFPKLETGLNKWLQSIPRERLGSLSFHELKKKFVCKKHFEKKFFTSSHVRSRLRLGAYPTLFSVSEIVDGVPERIVQLPDENRPLHRFPKPSFPHTEKFTKWKMILDKAIQDKGHSFIYNQIRLCNRHFEKCYHSPSNRLTSNAIPTLQLYDPKSKDHDYTTKKKHQDHAYCQAEKPKRLLPESEDDHTGNKCVLCDKKGISPSSDLMLSKFPLDRTVCRTWIQKVGLKELVHIPIQKLHETKFLCQTHFDPECFINEDNSMCLDAAAVPSKDLFFPMLPDSLLAAFPEEEETLGSQLQPSGIESINVDLGDDRSPDYSQAECLEEYIHDDVEMCDNFEPYDEDQTYDSATECQEASSIDEIDTLFLSYAGTFKKLSPNLQTMLKLDIAKLFARYEMKNCALQPVSDNQLPTVQDIPKAAVFEDQKTKDQKISRKLKRTFSKPKPVKKMTDSPNVFSHSEIVSASSRGPYKENISGPRKSECLITENSSPMNETSLEELIAKSGTRQYDDDNDGVELQTNDLIITLDDPLLKPSKIRKLGKDVRDANTAISLLPPNS